MKFAAPPNTFAPMQTWLPPLALSACVRVVITRSLAGMHLADAQRWGHFPISPMVALGCFSEGSADLLAAGASAHADAPRECLPRMQLAGPQTMPRTVFYSPSASGVMVVFYPDAWLALTGMSPEGLTDRFVDAHAVLPPDLLAVCARLCEAGDGRVEGGVEGEGEDAARIKRFFADLLPVWQQGARDSKHRVGPGKDGARTMAHWMEALALRAVATGWGRSLRQSERRIKHWTGWSLRKLQGSARGEAVFLAVLDAINDNRLDWTQIALDHGFSDQSHFIRETRRITGFSPEALRHGVVHEEAFWSYRVLAQISRGP
jgi:AraC-like DNA-binding protein